MFNDSTVLKYVVLLTLGCFLFQCEVVNSVSVDEIEVNSRAAQMTQQICLEKAPLTFPGDEWERLTPCEAGFDEQKWENWVNSMTLDGHISWGQNPDKKIWIGYYQKWLSRSRVWRF